MGRSSRMSFNLCSGVKTTPIIWRSQSLTCLSVWLGRKWIRTSRDEVCLSPGHQEPRWQGRPISRHYQSNIFPHTGVEWSEWTGSLAPVSIHIITSVGGSLENSQVITDCLSPLSSLRKISNFVIIIFGAWLASTLSNPPQPLLGKTKTEETLMILSFLCSSQWVWNIMEQSHYLHLVYLVLLPPHIYYQSNQSVRGHRVWGPGSVFEVEITNLETKPVNSQPKCLPILFILFLPSLNIWKDLLPPACPCQYKLYWIRISFNLFCSIFILFVANLAWGIKVQSRWWLAWLVSGHFVCQ